jgi:hypothetical protein
MYLHVYIKNTCTCSTALRLSLSRMYVCMYIYMQICMDLCIYVSMYLCIYVYIYTYICHSAFGLTLSVSPSRPCSLSLFPRPPPGSVPVTEHNQELQGNRTDAAQTDKLRDQVVVQCIGCILYRLYSVCVDTTISCFTVSYIIYSI